MKINKDKMETFWAVFLTLAVVSLFILLHIHAKHTMNKNLEIINNGKYTIGFVYKQQGLRIDENIFYYYFIDKYKYDGLVVHSTEMKPLMKFYKVYYIPNDKNKTVVDFSHEIPIDSVQYYFPKGQNPFEEEIEAIKEGRYKVSGWF